MSKIIVIEIRGENHVEPEIPELEVGDQINWNNMKDDAYEIKFTKGSPFEDGVAVYEIGPGGSALSRPIVPGKGSFTYQVSPIRRTREALFGPRGPIMEPTIVVKSPHE